MVGREEDDFYEAAWSVRARLKASGLDDAVYGFTAGQAGVRVED